MLIDAGPMAALINRRDQYHQPAQRVFNSLRDEPLLTPCPCLVEAMYLLGQAGGYRYQRRLFNLIARKILQVCHLTPEQEIRLPQLMERYQDRPMDYADAALIAIAASQRLHRIFTFDSDFHFYRLPDNSALEVIS